MIVAFMDQSAGGCAVPAAGLSSARRNDPHAITIARLINDTENALRIRDLRWKSPSLRCEMTAAHDATSAARRKQKTASHWQIPPTPCPQSRKITGGSHAPMPLDLLPEKQRLKSLKDMLHQYSVPAAEALIER